MINMLLSFYNCYVFFYFLLNFGCRNFVIGTYYSEFRHVAKFVLFCRRLKLLHHHMIILVVHSVQETITSSPTLVLFQQRYLSFLLAALKRRAC